MEPIFRFDHFMIKSNLLRLRQSVNDYVNSFNCEFTIKKIEKKDESLTDSDLICAVPCPLIHRTKTRWWEAGIIRRMGRGSERKKIFTWVSFKPLFTVLVILGLEIDFSESICTGQGETIWFKDRVDRINLVNDHFNDLDFSCQSENSKLTKRVCQSIP